MAHFKCVPCQARLYRPTFPADPVGDLCPGCGALLEQVGDLAEVVGFQAIKSRDGADAGGRPGTHERIAERVGDMMARREARLADAGRWLDDGDSFSPGSWPAVSSAATESRTRERQHCRPPQRDTPMRLLDRLRNRSRSARASKDGGLRAGSGHKRQLPIARFERDEVMSAAELEVLREEARYGRERLALYRARLYSGRADSQSKLRELERSSDGAAARLRRAEAKAPPSRRGS